MRVTLTEEISWGGQVFQPGADVEIPDAAAAALGLTSLDPHDLIYLVAPGTEFDGSFKAVFAVSGCQINTLTGLEDDWSNVTLPAGASILAGSVRAIKTFSISSGLALLQTNFPGGITTGAPGGGDPGGGDPVPDFQITTITSEVGTSPSGQQFTPSDSLLRVWMPDDAVDPENPEVDIYISDGVTTRQLRLYNYQSRLLAVTPNTALSFGTADGRQLVVNSSPIFSSLPAPSGVEGTANTDHCAPPYWAPSVAHITLASRNSAFQLKADDSSSAKDRLIFVSERDPDADTWTPARWYRQMAGQSLIIYCQYQDVALATIDGASIDVIAPSGSSIGGVSNRYSFGLVATGASRVVSTVAELESAIAAAVSGDEIVVNPGIYSLNAQITETSFAANHNVNGRVGAEGILIRGAVNNNRSAAVIAGNGISLTHQDKSAAEPTLFKDLSINLGGTSSNVELVNGVFRVENIRVTGGNPVTTAIDVFGIATEGSNSQNFVGIYSQFDKASDDLVNHSAENDSTSYFLCCTMFDSGDNSSSEVYTLFGNNSLNVLYACTLYDGGASSLVRHQTAEAYLYWCEAPSDGAGAKRIDFSNFYGCNIQNTNAPRDWMYFTQVQDSSFRNAASPIIGNRINSSNRANFASRGGGLFLFNIVNEAAEGFRLSNYGSSGSTELTVIQNNTFSGCNIALSLTEDSETLPVTLKNNACFNNLVALATTANSGDDIAGNYNIFDDETLDANYTPGANDVAAEAQLLVSLFPYSGANTQSGEPSLYPWIGGSDPDGLPVIYSQGSTPIGARALPVLGGQVLPDAWTVEFDVLVDSYINRVAAVGGTVSPTAALLLNSVITTNYNGLTYEDYSSKVIYLWAPVSSFSGITVPFKGDNFANNGFVASDWNIQSGLQGDGVSTLPTGIVVSDVSTFDDTSYGFYIKATDTVNRTGVRGGGTNGTCDVSMNNTRIGSNSSDNISFSAPNAAQSNTLYSGTRFSTSLLKGYVNGAIDGIDSNTQPASDTSSGTNEFDVMANELNGSVTPVTSEISASFLAVPALSDAEMLSLAQMIAALESGRSTLQDDSVGETENYRSFLDSQGATLSKTDADIFTNFVTKGYEVGEAQPVSVSSFFSKIRCLWMPFDFGHITVEASGGQPAIQINFADGDYSVDGLQGSIAGNKSIALPCAIGEIDVADTCIYISADLAGSGSLGMLVGSTQGGAGGSPHVDFYAIESSNSLVGRMNGVAASTVIFTYAYNKNVWSFQSTASNDFRAYEGIVEKDFQDENRSAILAGDSPMGLFARYNNSTRQFFSGATMRTVVISQALTTAERKALYLAIVEADFGRRGITLHPIVIANLHSLGDDGGVISYEAIEALNTALQAEYYGLTFDDYKDKLEVLWVSVSDFGGITAPLLGGGLISSGYNSSDWDLNQGLNSSSGKHLEAAITIADVNLLSVSIGVHYITGTLTGVNGSNNGTDAITISSGEAKIGNTSDAATQFISKGQADTIYSATRFNESLLRMYRDGVQESDDTAAISTPANASTQSITFGSQHLNGVKGEDGIVGRYASFFISNTALTDIEMRSLCLMLIAIQTSRATLPS